MKPVITRCFLRSATSAVRMPTTATTTTAFCIARDVLKNIAMKTTCVNVPTATNSKTSELTAVPTVYPTGYAKIAIRATNSTAKATRNKRPENEMGKTVGFDRLFCFLQGFSA